jgi:methyltransferase (TIGR00027 family)
MTGVMLTTMSERKLSRRDFLLSMLAAGLSGVLADLRGAFAQIDVQNAIPQRAKSTPMEEGRPSVTAQGAAIQRAAHQLLDVPKIFDDPLALRIIGANSESMLRSNLGWFQKSRFLRAFIVLRSRYAEDELVCALRRGIRQYVILGAGLDTFAYRNPCPGSYLRVFEVDHPATQSWKRARLREVEIGIPDSLTFAPVDFERQTLGDGLSCVGFRADEAAFFSLLGVVVYLTKTAVMETFKYVASRPAGSQIVFDYGILPSALSESQRIAREALENQVAAIGEPWITYFDPLSLASELRDMGFKHVEDFGPEEANQRYFKDRADSLRISGSSHLMKARV